ncbi:PP2C family protein-serine/threonine phosphatase [Roseomonas sp. AR75]|uniref:PP2C family protein-serine/threonine phosphatase n=1 Tax=Roseomonas sp. AR75 TaxID=2562311 RepID=UPI0010BF6BDB|nr:SpoIIE family protein phosphatase [Roseomonas sp. AR75]
MDDTERTMIRRTAPGPAPGEDAILHVLQVEVPPEDPARRVILGELPIRIGRVTGNDLVLAAPEVSRSHCSIVLEDGRAIVNDLGSTNGTHVNDQRLTAPTPLEEGARLRIGPFVLAYLRGPRRTLERAAELERNLDRAARYVRALLPPAIPEGTVRAAWRFEPSVRVGGDGFGYRVLPDGRFAVWLLDAAGHGIDSALLAASAMTVLREGGPPGAEPGDCAAVLAGLDTMFDTERHDGLFFTLWYGVYDPHTRRLVHVAGGHHAAYLVTPGAPEPLALGTRNLPVGAGLWGRAPQSGEAEIPPGARLYLFSDGAFETQRPDGKQNALADFLPVLHAPPVPGVPEPERLLEAARVLAGGAEFDDDVSILVLDFD